MANKLVAVEGCTLSLSIGAATQLKITSPASKIDKASGKGIYFGSLNVIINGFFSEKVDAASGSGVINPTANYVDSKGNKVVRLGDKTSPITVIGTKSGNPASDIVTVTISNAGQNKVKAE